MTTTPAFNATSAPASFSDDVVAQFLKTARENSLEALQAMIDRHGAAIVQVRDKDGKNAVRHAAETGRAPAIALLLDYGAQIETRDNEGRTPLMQAAGRGYLKMVQFLLDKGAQAEARDNNQWTPLMHAAYHEASRNTVPKMSKFKLATIQFLLEYGVKLDPQDSRGRTVEMQAEQRRNRDALELIRAEKEKRLEREKEYRRQMGDAFNKIKTGMQDELDAPVPATFSRRPPAAFAP